MGERDDREFEEALFRKHGYKIKPMAEDGNCLFRSVGALAVAVERSGASADEGCRRNRDDEVLLCWSGVIACMNEERARVKSVRE